MGDRIVRDTIDIAGSQLKRAIDCVPGTDTEIIRMQDRQREGEKREMPSQTLGPCFHVTLSEVAIIALVMTLHCTLAKEKESMVQ